jgi:hypothetical protein
VVFLVAGTVLGLVAKSTYDHAIQAECGGNPNACSASGASDGTSAHVDAAAATVAFAAGTALVAGGAVLLLTLPGGTRTSIGASVDDRGAGVIARGTF